MWVRGAPARQFAVRAVAGAALLVAALSLVGWALGERTIHVERQLMAHIMGARAGQLTGVAKVLSTIGSRAVLVPVAGLSAAWLYLRRRSLAAMTVLVATTGAVALPDVVKLIVGRPRPETVHLVPVASASFPSGHAAQGAGILLALAWALTTAGRRRLLAVTVAAAAAVAIGWSRVYLGVHYPSDVVAGWLLGTGWFAYTAVIAAAGAPVLDTRSGPAGAPRT
jgi:membrane-associated phospholipid phosphatase